MGESCKPKRPFQHTIFLQGGARKILRRNASPGLTYKEIAAKWKALDDKDGKQFDEEAGHEKGATKWLFHSGKLRRNSEEIDCLSRTTRYVLREKVPTFTSPKLLLELYFQQRVAETANEAAPVSASPPTSKALYGGTTHKTGPASRVSKCCSLQDLGGLFKNV
ncbi:hypothetical protein MHU86_7739 [Fragilaria crotonensis]|nr:hypothetical protein MHU86_7739 [Fragilaria crotonensis]